MPAIAALVPSNDSKSMCPPPDIMLKISHQFFTSNIIYSESYQILLNFRPNYLFCLIFDNSSALLCYLDCKYENYLIIDALRCRVYGVDGLGTGFAYIFNIIC